jgi:hypothetical protein
MKRRKNRTKRQQNDDLPFVLQLSSPSREKATHNIVTDKNLKETE